MSLFGKKPDNQPPGQTKPAPARPVSPPTAPAPAPPAASPRTPPEPGRGAGPERRSFLGSGCELEGDLGGAGSLECSGTFDGSIDISGDLVIGHGGTVKAAITARRITIEGRLHGDATGAEKVEVGSSGHVEGDVRAPAVQFAEGAFFEGNVEMRRAGSGAAKESG